MEMKQCAKGGHFYDASIHAECPYCAKAAEVRTMEDVGRDGEKNRPSAPYKFWVAFYTDFLERMGTTPWRDSASGCFMEDNLLRQISECAKNEGIEMDPFLLGRIHTLHTILEEEHHVRMRWED